MNNENKININWLTIKYATLDRRGIEWIIKLKVVVLQES